MSEDLHVRSIRLLEAYHKSFNNYSYTTQQKINSYLAVLESQLMHARQLRTNFHDFLCKRKSWLYNAEQKMASAMAEKPPVPRHVANAIEKYESCKEAYETAQKYDEQCESMVKKLNAQIDQARQQCYKYRSEISAAANNGSRFLSDYIRELRSYSDQNG